MSALFSKSCKYGFQAVLYLATQESVRPLRLKDIASALHLPYDFLSKIFQKLSRGGIVRSQKGQHGGFVLARSAETITLNDIVVAIDGVDSHNQCVLGFPGCSDLQSCSAHSYWKAILQIVAQMLNEKNVADLSRGIEAKIALLNPAPRKRAKPDTLSVMKRQPQTQQ